MIKDQWWMHSGLALGFASIVAVGACSAGEPADEDETATTEQAVTSGCTAHIVTSPTANATFGSSVSVTVDTSSCPAGATPAYQLYVKNPQANGGGFAAVGAQQSSTAFTYDTSTGIAGTNTFEVGVRKSGSTETQAFSNTVAIAVADTIAACTTTRVSSPANNSTVQAGNPITFQATSAGCPTPEYEFWFKASTTQTWTVVSNNPANPTADQFIASPPGGQITFPGAGTYAVTVVARGTGAHLGAQGYSARASNAITLTVTAAATNHAPVANPDSATANRGETITINPLANDTDADNDTLSLVSVSAGTLGTVTVTGNSVSYAAGSATGTDVLTYTVSDGHTTSQGTITVTIADQAPVANDLSYSISRNGSASDTLADLCSDADGDALTAALVTAPTNGTASFDNTGAMTYQATRGFTGNDSFTYACNDGTLSSNTATLSFTVTNHAPVANNDTASTHAATTIDVLANDTDADGDTLTVTQAGGATHGTVAIVGGTEVRYTPTTGFAGSDSFTYTISDGLATASASVAVTVGNTAPTAVNDSYSTAGGTTLSVAAASGVLANDSDPDGDAITAVLVSGPAHGTLTLNSNGSFTYTPNSSFDAVDSFTYEANDGAANSTAATVSIAVGDQAPVAVADTFTGTQNQPLSFNVLTNDTDANNDSLTVDTASVSALSNPAAGTLLLGSDGAGTFTPSSTFTGSVSFTYAANDGTSDSNSATVTLTIGAGAAGCTVSVTGGSGTINVPSTVTATAHCNTGNAEIEWLAKPPGGASFAVFSAFSQASTAQFTPTALGSYQLEAIARTVGTTTPLTTSSAATFTVADTNPACTGTIRVTAPAQGATLHVNTATTVAGIVNTGTCSNGQAPEYEVWAKVANAANWTIFPAFSSSGTLTWSGPTSTGSWAITVVARSQGNHSSSELRANSVTVTVVP